MFQSDLEKLKSIVAEEKSKRPQKPAYSDAVKSSIAGLTRTMSVAQISSALGVSPSFVERVKQSSIRKKSVSKEKNIEKSVPDLHFLQIPSDIKKDKHNDQQRFMKVTTPNGLIVEIWG